MSATDERFFSWGGVSVRGRDQFRLVKPLLTTLSRMFSVLPAGVLRAIWQIMDLGSGAVSQGIRFALLKAQAKECGQVVSVGPNVEIRSPEQLSLGDHVSLHRGCYLDATGGLTIGCNVSIAHQSSVLTSNHTWSDRSLPIRDNAIKLETVVIHDDVWIGCGCRILSGVTIGSRTVVAAGSVVTKPLKGNAVYGGVPARKLKSMNH